MKEYEERIVEEICRDCNFAERIIVKIFKKIVLKTYHISRVNNLNKFLN